MPGLLRGVARTAVIAGTATSVSNRVSRRQGQRWAQQEEQQQAPAPVAAAPAAGGQSTIDQLKELGELKAQGIGNMLAGAIGALPITSVIVRSSANVKGHSGDWEHPSTSVPADSLLRQAAEVINHGSRVAILVGRGALKAREEVAQLAEAVGGPVVKALLGKGVLPDRSPYTTGGIGLLGTSPSVDAMEECDTLIMIGTSFPYMDFLPKPGQAKCVQIELNPTRVGLRHPVDVALVGDAKAVLHHLLPHAVEKLMAKNTEAVQSDAPSPSPITSGTIHRPSSKM